MPPALLHAPPRGLRPRRLSACRVPPRARVVGKLIVSPISQPFLLGSPEHKAAINALARPAYAEPVLLPEGLRWFSGSCLSTHASHSVLWSTTAGMFRKRVRASAHSAEAFGSMHRVYTALELALPDCPLASLPHRARLLYGAHEVLVEIELIEGESCDDEDVFQPGSVQDSVAQAIVWLAQHRVVYTDLRGSNVIRRPSASDPGGAAAGSSAALVPAVASSTDGPREEPMNFCAALVDFDDAMLMPAAIVSLEEYEAVLATRATQFGTFATGYAAGGFPHLRAALGVAFGRATV